MTTFSGIYFASCMGIIAISVGATVVMLNFHHRKPENYQMTPWVNDPNLGGEKVHNGLKKNSTSPKIIPKFLVPPQKKSKKSVSCQKKEWPLRTFCIMPPK